MGQDHISKETGELLDQRVHVVTTHQELLHIIRNSMRLELDYLGTYGPLSQVMEICPHHIDRFEWKFDQDFSGNRIFGTGIVDWIRKMVQMFMHSFNTTSLDDVKTGALTEFRELQWQVDNYERFTPPPPHLGRNYGAEGTRSE